MREEPVTHLVHKPDELDLKLKLQIILICLLLLSACSTNGSDDKLERKVYKGTQGVVVDLFEGEFPGEAYEGQDLNFVLKLTNFGAYDSTATKLIVSLEKDYMLFILLIY